MPGSRSQIKKELGGLNPSNFSYYGEHMEYILLGILVGWLLPRPVFIGRIEFAIWRPIKTKFPSIKKYFG